MFEDVFTWALISIGERYPSSSKFFSLFDKNLSEDGFANVKSGIMSFDMVFRRGRWRVMKRRA